LLILTLREKLGLVPELDRASARFVYPGLLLAATAACAAKALRDPTERSAWALVAVGLTSLTAGTLYHAFLLSSRDLTISAADSGHLGFYPAAYAALILLLRGRVASVGRAVALDGVVAALAVAAIAVAVVLHVVQPRAGTTPSGLAFGLVYPLGDCLLLALVVGVLAFTGWRADGMWNLILGSLVVLLVTDVTHLYVLTIDSAAPRLTSTVGWPAAAALLAFAAWQPRGKRTRARVNSSVVLAVPALFALASLGVLVLDHFVHLYSLAVVLAWAALVAVIVRMVLTFRENVRILAGAQRDALLDPLTGLGNRRRLVADLHDACESDTQALLVLFDLDGFKTYNDTFGHPAGDALLTRLARNLEAAVEGVGSAYRMGGDEFCVLAPVSGEEARHLGLAAALALSERGELFQIGCSYGASVIPVETRDPSDALRLADRRLYAAKHSGRPPASHQSKEVLVRALQERDEELGVHIDGVAELAVSVGYRLGLEPFELEELRTAAELHDVGKMAIPDAILKKPAPLDDEEWHFIRRHTVIGERILSAAPALAEAGRIVRASHERFDGTGYPDGIAGDEIPLGARVIAVCDAYDAMTSTRPYRLAMSDEKAVEELRHCAGTQFDPEVVQAFLAILSEWDQAPIELRAAS
jgi:diguanylate cyclase (GGDEF)-like protein